MKPKTYHTLLILLATLTLATSCTINYKYKIGVSQCVGGRWAIKPTLRCYRHNISMTPMLR